MLTNIECQNAAPLADRNWKLADSQGLYLLIRKTGRKVWCWKFRFGGKEKKLVFGAYPEIKPKKARDMRDAARGQLLKGIDPSALAEEDSVAGDESETFEVISRAWFKKRAKTLDPRYSKQLIKRMEDNVFPSIGAKQIRSITAPMVLKVLRPIEARGALEMAHRVRGHISDVFVWAIASGLAEQDPAGMVRKALEPTNGRLRPAMIKIDRAREVITKSEALPDVHWATRLASRLTALTAARPGVVRKAEIHEFEGLDGAEPIWRIPAAKMKLSRERKRDAAFEFVVPLSKQAVATVKAAIGVTTSQRWLFPGISEKDQPISDSTLSKHYRDAGFAGKHVPHGWRASFSTIMNERAAAEDRERDRAIIDLMLAHMQEGVEASYNRAAYMPRRRELAQAWADMLMAGLRAPVELIPPELRG